MNVALCSRPLNIISLCSGGGGLDLGLELAIPSARPVCYVEREAFAAAHLVAAMRRKLMAHGPIWSDVGTFDGRPWRGVVDGLIGGIPCQPHSLAGRKRGSLDDRDLWSDARRIIVQARPWFVLIENVAGMLAAGDDEIAGAERVHRDLRKLGFEVEGGLFTAAEVGASHQRERVFILAVADYESRGRGDRSDTSERHQSSRADRSSRVNVPGVGQADTYSERLEGIRTDVGTQGRPDAGRSAGLRDRAALVDAASIGRGEGRPKPELRSWRDTIASASTAMGNAAGNGQPNINDRHDETRQYVEPVSGATSGNPRGDHADRGRAIGEAAGAFRPLFPPGPADRDGWREVLTRSPELEPAFRRVADGLAAGVDHAQRWSRVDRLRMLGNGVVPLEAGYAIRTLIARLAARGSNGAAKLMGMMEGIEA